MTVLIVEDEAAAARRLEKMLLEIDPAIEVLGHLDSVENTAHWLSENKQPDLMLLDIHLADGSSFELFEHVRVHCPIIFTTAYDEYALQAFKVNAVDYLLKPIKSAELAQAIEKYRGIYQVKTDSDYRAIADSMQPAEKPAYLRRLLVRLGNSMKLIDMDDVAYFYTRDKITFLVSRGTGRRMPVDYPLDRLERLLDPKVFFRINRQFIVAVGSIREMHPYSKSRLKLDLEPAAEQETVVSTERSSDFRRWLTGGIE